MAKRTQAQIDAELSSAAAAEQAAAQQREATAAMAQKYMAKPETQQLGKQMIDDATAQYQTAIKDIQERKKTLSMEKQGLNPDGSPIAPDYMSQLDEQGNLLDKFKVKYEEMDPSKLQGYNMLKELATRTGPSDYAKKAAEQAQFLGQSQMDAAARQALSGTANANAQLAMRGGISSGARERLAMGGARDLLGARQDTGRATAGNLLNIGLQDEQMKREALSQFGNAEGQIANQNLGLRNRTMSENVGGLKSAYELQNTYNMDTYKGALDKWGANKQAESTRSSGGGK